MATDLTFDPLRRRVLQGEAAAGVLALMRAPSHAQSSASRHRDTSTKGNDFSTEYDLRVVARERVRVPAGEFDAFRVDGNGRLRGETGMLQMTMRYWVTPGVRRFIAMENTRKSSLGKLFKNYRVELMEYCCG